MFWSVVGSAWTADGPQLQLAEPTKAALGQLLSIANGTELGRLWGLPGVGAGPFMMGAVAVADPSQLSR
jgi:hypothetical protein